MEIIKEKGQKFFYNQLQGEFQVIPGTEDLIILDTYLIWTSSVLFIGFKQIPISIRGCADCVALLPAGEVTKRPVLLL